MENKPLVKNKNNSSTSDTSNSPSQGSGSHESGKDKFADIALQIEDVKGIMHKNIETAISRGEDLEVLQGRSEELENNAARFKTNATNLRRTMCLKNAKNIVILVMIVLVIVGVLAGVIYGATKK